MKETWTARLAYLLSLMGLFVTWMLTASYVLHRQLPCGASDGCTQVALAPNARFLPVIGLVFYVGMTTLLVRNWTTNRPITGGLVSGFVLAVAALSVGLSAWSVLVLHEVCGWCLAHTVIVCLLAFVLSWDKSPRSPARGGRFVAIGLILTLVAMGSGVQALRRQGRPFPWNPEVLARLSPRELAPPDSTVVSAPANKATIVIFLDLQCPACQATFRQLYPLIVREKLGLVVRSRPHKVHPDALRMSVLLEIALQNGVGAAFLDQAFAADIADAKSAGAAFRSLGLTVTPAARSGAKLKIQRDLQLAKRLGINETPTLFILKPGSPPQGVLPAAVPTLIQGGI